MAAALAAIRVSTRMHLSYHFKGRPLKILLTFRLQTADEHVALESTCRSIPSRRFKRRAAAVREAPSRHSTWHLPAVGGVTHHRRRRRRPSTPLRIRHRGGRPGGPRRRRQNFDVAPAPFSFGVGDRYSMICEKQNAPLGRSRVVCKFTERSADFHTIHQQECSDAQRLTSNILRWSPPKPERIFNVDKTVRTMRVCLPPCSTHAVNC